MACYLTIASVPVHCVVSARMMEHPAFAEAGEAPGIEIWTIDKFEPVAIERKLYGKFYNGDSYIVLKTTGDTSTSLSYDVHFWLGSKTTQDKKGAAAILTITLDDKLGGRAVHHREVQGHETSLFLGYFQPAIRYLEGGNESGFNEVETNAGAEKRLLKLSGCDNMRIEEVPAEGSSLTKDHCFILEYIHDIFVLMPEGARATQRRKIISVANSLRDDYHNGRATIEIIDEFSSDEDIAMFYEALGCDRADLEEEESITAYSRESMTTVYFYKVLQGDDMELVALNKPFKQKHLTSEDIFILDTPCSGVYIWLGKDVDPDVKKNYNDIVQKYLDDKGYPAWVAVTRVSEGSESSTFKQYFHNWETVTATTASVRTMASQIDAGYFSDDRDDAEAMAKYIGKSAAARGYMPDEGAGAITVTRISGEPEDITESFLEAPKMYQSEVYVVKYQYEDENGDPASVIYVWIGTEADDDSKKAGYEYVGTVEEELGGDSTIVKIPQGKETKHFLNLFKGNLVVLRGDKSSEYKAENFNNSYDDDGVRLFRVEGTKIGEDMRAIQIPEAADQLEDDDVYILETPSMVYVWNGKEAQESEKEKGKYFVSHIVDGEKEVTVIDQGEETDAFLEALGGTIEGVEDTSGWRLTVNRRLTTPVSLTAVSVTVTGKIKFEELPPDFSQQDLSDDGIYVLDTGEELYLWEGKNIPERVKRVRGRIVGEYIEDDGLDRTADSAIVVFVKQGKEPSVFRKLFSSWDSDLWDNQTSYEDLKNETKEKNSN